MRRGLRGLSQHDADEARRHGRRHRPNAGCRSRRGALVRARGVCRYGQQAAEPGPGGAVGRVDEERRRIGEVEPAAGKEPEAGFAAALEGAHHAGDGVAVGDADGRVAEVGGGLHQFLDMARAPKEGVVGGYLQLDVGPLRHAPALIPSCADFVPRIYPRGRLAAVWAPARIGPRNECAGDGSGGCGVTSASKTFARPCWPA